MNFLRPLSKTLRNLIGNKAIRKSSDAKAAANHFAKVSKKLRKEPRYFQLVTFNFLKNQKYLWFLLWN